MVVAIFFTFINLVFFLNLVEAKDKEKIQILNPDFFLLINYLVNLRLNKLRVDPPSSLKLMTLLILMQDQ